MFVRKIRFRARGLLAMSLGCAVALTPVTWSAGAVAAEQPPVVSAASILGAQVRGQGFTVDQEVPSDGFIRVFTLRMASGTYEIGGDRLMQVRLSELAALRRLKAMSESDTFRKSFGRAAAAPVRFGQNLLNDPGATVRGTASGISNMFDRADSAVSNIGDSRDSVGSSLLGVDSARRELAFTLGIDPYTDFPPLASALSDMSRAAAGGTLTVKALTMAVPGAAGVAISATSTATRSRDLLRDSTSTQIIDRVRDMLGRLGVSASLADRLTRNRNYTPADLITIAVALNELRARNSAIFVARASEAVARDEAFFQRSRPELLAAQGGRLGLMEFVSVGGFPLNRARDGRIVAVFPFDSLSWTDGAERAFQAATMALGRMGAGKTGTLVMTGNISPTALAEITKLGWAVTRLP